MGAINIKVEGSFNPMRTRHESFSAENFGHAAAVAEAIKWLSEELLPQAIKLDHALHEKGLKPNKGFGKE